MKNKSKIIIKTLVDTLRINRRVFGEFAIEEKHGINGSRAEITMLGKAAERYSVVVIKLAES